MAQPEQQKRYEIYELKKAGFLQKETFKHIEVDSSTINLELKNLIKKGVDLNKLNKSLRIGRNLFRNVSVLLMKSKRILKQESKRSHS